MRGNASAEFEGGIKRMLDASIGKRLRAKYGPKETEEPATEEKSEEELSDDDLKRLMELLEAREA